MEKYAVQLMPEEPRNSASRVTTRARILLKTDEGWTAPGSSIPHQAAFGRCWKGSYGTGPRPDRPKVSRHGHWTLPGKAVELGLVSSLS